MTEKEKLVQNIMNKIKEVEKSAKFISNPDTYARTRAKNIADMVLSDYVSREKHEEFKRGVLDIMRKVIREGHSFAYARKLIQELEKK